VIGLAALQAGPRPAGLEAPSGCVRPSNESATAGLTRLAVARDIMHCIVLAGGGKPNPKRDTCIMMTFDTDIF